MNDPDTQHANLDRILDSALESYSAREPQLGIDQRVLRRVSEAQPTKQVSLKWAVAAVPILAACVFTVTFFMNKKPEALPQSNMQQSVEATNSIPARILPTANRKKSSPVVQVQLAAETLPRLGVFPTPQPLTREQRELAQMNSQINRLQVSDTLTPPIKQDEPELSVEPIRIAAIEIAPLDGMEQKPNQATRQP
jgi:hypothetical protein